MFTPGADLKAKGCFMPTLIVLARFQWVLALKISNSRVAFTAEVGDSAVFILPRFFLSVLFTIGNQQSTFGNEVKG